MYAGRDALTGRNLYLTETVPAGPNLDDRAEQVRAALVAAVAQGEHPRTYGTIDELMERHLAEAKLGRKTRDSYLGYHRKHITPLLGKLKINGVLDPELLDVSTPSWPAAASTAPAGRPSSTGPTVRIRARIGASGTSVGRWPTGPSARSTGCSTAATSAPSGASGR
ncbi:MAG: hypothetical protein ACJ72N_03330 [Labedaea sp.]